MTTPAAMHPLPLIIAHGPGSLGEVLILCLLSLLSLLIPVSFVLGVLLPPLLLLQPHQFRQPGLPALPQTVRQRQRRRALVAILINGGTFAFWVSLFVHDAPHYPHLMPMAVAAFLGAEALVFLLRWVWCRHQASRQGIPS